MYVQVLTSNNLKVNSQLSLIFNSSSNNILISYLCRIQMHFNMCLIIHQKHSRLGFLFMDYSLILHKDFMKKELKRIEYKNKNKKFIEKQ